MDINRTNLLPEIRLAEQARAGSKEAFSELYGRYKDRLYRYALYRLGSPEDAEDAVSECVLAAWQALSQLKSPEAFGAWIFRILHNCCIRQISRAAGLRSNMQDIYESQAVVRGDEQASVSVELSEALARLSEEERSIVLLSVIGDLTSREVSEITGLTPGSVRSKLSRSLAKMRELL